MNAIYSLKRSGFENGRTPQTHTDIVHLARQEVAGILAPDNWRLGQVKRAPSVTIDIVEWTDVTIYTFQDLAGRLADLLMGK